MNNKYDVVIIGSGSAGRTAAETLVERNSGFSILLVDSEGLLPYKRTKVSKSIAAGFQPEDFAVRAAEWYAENGISLSDADLSDIHPDTHTVVLSDNSGGKRTIEYRYLLLAFGAEPLLPFTLPGDDKCSVLWTVAHGLNLSRCLKNSRRLVIVGMGVLGVEAADQAVSMNIDTTLLGRTGRPMSRFLDEPTAAPLTKVMKAAGVKLHFNTNAVSVSIENNEVAVSTDKGRFTGDYVVVAAGALPRSSLAGAAGMAVGRGILVDRFLRTSLPDIWAAGDCAEHPDGTVTGLWHSAEYQGRLAALSILGEPLANDNPPFRLKCEVFGGFWFSAGPVNAPSESGKLEEAETWETKHVLWRPRFGAGRLKALAAAAPEGMDKAMAKNAQRAIREAWTLEETRALLVG